MEKQIIVLFFITIFAITVAQKNEAIATVSKYLANTANSSYSNPKLAGALRSLKSTRSGITNGSNNTDAGPQCPLGLNLGFLGLLLTPVVLLLKIILTPILLLVRGLLIVVKKLLDAILTFVILLLTCLSLGSTGQDVATLVRNLSHLLDATLDAVGALLKSLEIVKI